MPSESLVLITAETPQYIVTLTTIIACPVPTIGMPVKFGNLEFTIDDVMWDEGRGMFVCDGGHYDYDSLYDLFHNNLGLAIADIREK